MANPFFDMPMARYAAQFRDENGQLVFRKNLTGRSVPVTAAERDAALAWYERHYRAYFKRTFVGLGVIIVGGVIAMALTGPAAFKAPVMIMAFGWFVGNMIYFRHLAAAPGNALSRRSAVGGRLRDAEVQQAKLDAWGWPALLSFIALSVALVALGLVRGRLDTSLIVPGLMLVGLGYLAIRKLFSSP